MRSVGFVRVAILALLVWAYSGSFSFAADRIGIVLMHGKGGHPGAGIDTLAAKLSAAGFLVEAPEMPWSRNRIYDRDYEESMAEIDAVVAIAPGHTPGSPGFRRELGKDVDAARQLVASGKGEEVISGGDINQGEYFPRKIRARIYLSWFDPTGPASMPRNAPMIKPGVPLLWVVGEEDRIHPHGKGLVFDRAPSHPKSAYVVVSGGHIEAPTSGADKIVSWLKGL